MIPLLPIFSFLGTNIKWVAIGLIAIVIAFGAWRYTKLVENYAIAKQTISALEQNLKDKERALQFERDLAKLSDSIITKLDTEKEQLVEQIDEVTKELSDDADDLAPESIRQTIKRLKELK